MLPPVELVHQMNVEHLQVKIPVRPELVGIQRSFQPLASTAWGNSLAGSNLLGYLVNYPTRTPYPALSFSIANAEKSKGRQSCASTSDNASATGIKSPQVMPPPNLGTPAQSPGASGTVIPGAPGGSRCQSSARLRKRLMP